MAEDEIKTFGTFTKGDQTRVAGTIDMQVKLVYEGWSRQGEPEHEPQLTGAPPKAGAGSSREAWTAYAKANGMDVVDEQSRDDIIDSLHAAGITTEHKL